MSKALASLASIAVRNRELVWELTRRELMQPQANHFLGRYWLFMHPAISILVLFSVFYFVYPTRLEGVNPRGFEVYLLSALIPWVVISELMARACPLIRANTNLVKQIVFPLETLVVKTILASLFVQLVMSAVVFVILFTTSAAVSPLFLPLWLAALVIQSAFMLGLTLILASITPFIPDMEDLVSLIARAGLFWRQCSTCRRCSPLMYGGCSISTRSPTWYGYIETPSFTRPSRHQWSGRSRSSCPACCS